jgi:hypothetical protein
MSVTSNGFSIDYPSDPTVSGAGRTGPHLASSVLLGGLLLTGVLSGTSTTTPVAAPHIRYIGDWTSSARTLSDDTLVSPISPGPVESAPLDVSGHRSATQQATIRWLHEQSGLTWDQLSRVFGVSRRAVHLWVTGGRMNAANAETLTQLLSLVRELPADNPSDRRAVLLAPDRSGRSLLDRLRSRQAGGAGDVSGTPWAPDQLLGARHDRPSSAT